MGAVHSNTIELCNNSKKKLRNICQQKNRYPNP